MTIDSKNHLVAPAVSIDDYPVIQEDAHRRLSKEEQQALDLATEEERQTARTIVSRLHVEAILILEELSIIFEENTHKDSSLLLPKSSVAVLAKKVRDEGYVQWLLEFFMNLARVFKWTNSSGSIQC